MLIGEDANEQKCHHCRKYRRQKIVIINSIRFAGKYLVRWTDIKEYLKTFVSKYYRVEDTNNNICIGNDLPNEYTSSACTYKLKGVAAKAKTHATQELLEMIKIATGKHFHENNNEEHYRNAALGWHRFDSSFALLTTKIAKLSGIMSFMSPCSYIVTKMEKCIFMMLWT